MQRTQSGDWMGQRSLVPVYEWKCHMDDPGEADSTVTGDPVDGEHHIRLVAVGEEEVVMDHPHLLTITVTTGEFLLPCYFPREACPSIRHTVCTGYHGTESVPISLVRRRSMQ